MNRRIVLGLSALLVLAFAIAFALRGGAVQLSETPSIENAGPRGLAALEVYLREGGHDVRALRARLDRVPAELGVLVIAAPGARRVETEEVRTLRDWVKRGGTLVYLVPSRASEMQPALNEWLPTGERPGLSASTLPGVADASGATATVHGARGPFIGVEALRVSRWFTLTMDGAEVIAGEEDRAAVLRVSEGEGDVWLFAGADVAENRRLELLDNLQLWENLAALGPIGFDEFHHQVPPPPPVSLGLWAVIAQAVLCAGVYVIARGTRLGPPRPRLIERQRSIREYLEAFAALTRRAKVERELVSEQLARVRRLMHERAGVPITVSQSEAANLLEQALEIDATSVERLLRRMEDAAAGAPTPREYFELTREVTHLERRLTGRAAPLAEPG